MLSRWAVSAGRCTSSAQPFGQYSRFHAQSSGARAFKVHGITTESECLPSSTPLQVSDLYVLGCEGTARTTPTQTSAGTRNSISGQ